MRSLNVVELTPPAKSLWTPNFVALVLTQTCFGLSFSCFFLLPTYLKLVLHASDVQIGAVASLGSLAGVFAFPLVGTLNDRFGCKPFLLIGNVVMACAAAAMLRVTEVGAALYVLRALHGLCLALVLNSATTLVSAEVPFERLGHALAVFGSSLLATHAVAPALSELLASQHGWPTVFWFATVLAVLGVLASLRVQEAPRSRDEGASALGFVPLLRRPRTQRVVLTIAAAGASFGTVFTFHQPYALSLGMQHVSGFFLAYAACALLSRLWLTTRLQGVDRKQLSAWFMLLYAAAVVCAVWLRPLVLEGVGAVMGVAQGVFYPVFNALAVEGVEPRQRGSMMALYHGGFNGGIAGALLLGGNVAERFGYPTLFVGSALITAAAALSLRQSTLAHESDARDAAGR